MALQAVVASIRVAQHAPWVTGPRLHRDGPNWKAWGYAGRFHVPAQDTEADVSAPVAPAFAQGHLTEWPDEIRSVKSGGKGSGSRRTVTIEVTADPGPAGPGGARRLAKYSNFKVE
jgi:hypothetical protein